MSDITTLIGNPDFFPVLRKWHFFNHAGVSPLPEKSAQAIRQYADDAQTNSYLSNSWFGPMHELRKSAATMINATPEEIALVKNTAEGISLVANGIDWVPGDRVVATSAEYPTNIYPWMEVARRRGVELTLVPEETDADGCRHVPMDRILQAADHPRTRLVALSHVEFASGQRHDLARLGKFCRDNGKLFSVDAIQSLGAVPVDVTAMNIDYLSVGGHKWLLGPLGTGIFYCRRQLLDSTHPLTVGAMSVVHSQEYSKFDYTLRPDAARHESGGQNIAGLLALKTSLELLHSLGATTIEARLKLLTDRLIAGVTQKGYQVISPRKNNAFSGIVCFGSTKYPAEDQLKQLRAQHQIELVLRLGKLRCSAHFYNTEQQIDRLVEALPAH